MEPPSCQEDVVVFSKYCRIGLDVRYHVHCPNHQLHLVVVHVMSAEPMISDLFELCNSLYKFCRKPTVAVHCKGAHLKRLLEQRWTGHLATVSVIRKSFDDIMSILTDADTVLDYGAETRMEAAGLLREVSEPRFSFIANATHKVLSLLDPPNKILQREDTDLMTGLSVTSATACIKQLRCDGEFRKVLDAVTTTTTSDTPSPRPKRRRLERTRMDGYLVMESTGVHITTGEDELKRLYYSIIDLVVREMERRFSERNSQLASALAALNPQADNFLDVETVRPILDLSQSPITDAEFQVDKEFLSSQKHETGTVQAILSNYHIQLSAMPSIYGCIQTFLNVTQVTKPSNP